MQRWIYNKTSQFLFTEVTVPSHVRNYHQPYCNCKYSGRRFHQDRCLAVSIQLSSPQPKFAGELWGGVTPKPLTMGNIFFQNRISTWHLLYTVIHNHLKIYYFHYLSALCWKTESIEMCLLRSRVSITRRLQSYSLRTYTVKIRKANYLEKSCFEQKNAEVTFPPLPQPKLVLD